MLSHRCRSQSCTRHASGLSGTLSRQSFVQLSAPAARAAFSVPVHPNITSKTTTTFTVTSFLVFPRRILARHARGLIECGANALRKLESIIVRPKVHEEQAWLFGEVMAV